jgi:hypothetical protein
VSEPLPALDRPVNYLVSFPYYRKANLTDYVTRGLRLIADSGAYSAHHLGVTISVDAYADWLTPRMGSLAWAASLDDRANDVEHCWRNYRRLRHHHRLDVVPTIHAGDPPATLDRYAAEDVDLIGLGGLVPHRGRPKATMPWLVAVMRYARDRHPQIRFHGWGVTSWQLLAALPFFSADSSSIASAYRYGRLSLFDPTTATFTGLVIDGHGPRTQHELLTRGYGLATEDCLTSTPANRTMWVRLAVRSLQLHQGYLRQRHGLLSPPRYAAADTVPGLQLFVVDAAPSHVHRLMTPLEVPA